MSEEVAEAVEAALLINLADALGWDWDEEPPSVPSVKDVIAGVVADLMPSLRTAIAQALTDKQPMPVCTDQECPIYERHRLQGRSFPPHGPHDFRAAGP